MWKPGHWHNINLNFPWKTRFAWPLKIHKNILFKFHAFYIALFSINQVSVWLEDKSINRPVRGISIIMLSWNPPSIFHMQKGPDFQQFKWFLTMQRDLTSSKAEEIYRRTWISVKMKKSKMEDIRHKKDINESEINTSQLHQASSLSYKDIKQSL